MPWKETCCMKERMEMVSLFRTGRYTVSGLARRFGVSRKTAHKWLGRYAREGVLGLDERSRAPYRRPRATPTPVVLAVLRAKEAHPTWGPAKLLATPEESSEVVRAWPAVSTRGRILALHDMVTHRRRRRRVVPWTQPFLGADHPNAVWCADFKGWVRTGDGARCDPLTISDAYSRMLLCCHILPKPDYAHVRPCFERVFREYGLPLAIRTDNGPPFASVGLAGLSPLSVWWVKLGIIPERIQPGHPEQNGRHERMHRTLKQEVMHPPAANPKAQQRRCDDFRVVYNTLRPHEALGQVTPASCYAPSTRPYPHWLSDVQYPPLTEVRRVRSNGQIKWRGELVFISTALIGELVGITEQEDAWLVSFASMPLGRLYPHKATLEPLPHTLNPYGKSVTHVFS